MLSLLAFLGKYVPPVTTTTTTSAPTTSTTAAPPPPTTTVAPPPTTTPAPVTWYCSTTYLDINDEYANSRFTTFFDQSGTSGCSSSTSCLTSGYPAYPSPPC